MNGGALAARLAAAGLDPVEVPLKVRLFDLVLGACAAWTNSSPTSSCWVPGRLEFFGTHTDYAGGRTIVAALPRGFAFAARRRADDVLRVTDAAAPASFELDTAGRRPAAHAEAPDGGWTRYIETVARRLRLNFPDAHLGADVVFASDLPPAAGMSSSSALMIGLATVLVRLSGIRTSEAWQASIAGPPDEAGYYACMENGQTFGRLAGDRGVGTHGGSEDHAAIVCGVAGSLTEYAFVPMRRIDSARLPLEWQLVVASSGVAAEKTGAALDKYNRLARGALALLNIWNGEGPPVSSLAAALASDTTAAARLRLRLRIARVDGWTADALESRLEHFLREDARVPQAMLAVRACDPDALGNLARASQDDAAALLGNQLEETIALSKLALDCGAFASRSFGAGFGGSVWALVGRERAAAFLEDWLAAYRSRFDNPRLTGFVAPPAPPLLELGTEP